MLGCDQSTCPKVQGLRKSEVIDKVPIIWVLGGPGSGKGTQCGKIVEKYGFVHLSTGDLLRDEVKSGSARGEGLKAIMDKGELVPNELVLELLNEAILINLCSSKGFLIDGYPRERDQGLLFEKKIAPVTCIIFFEVTEKTMLDRLRKRAKVSGRSDDNEETMKKRLVTFNRECNAILEQYRPKVKRIFAEKPIEAVFADVQRVLDASLAKKFKM